MDSMEDLNKKLKILRDEIQDYQKSCAHKQQYIKFDKQNNAMWYCKKCEKMIRIPTHHELQEWIKK
jgi:hypothetical protein